MMKTFGKTTKDDKNKVSGVLCGYIYNCRCFLFLIDYSYVTSKQSIPDHLLNLLRHAGTFAICIFRPYLLEVEFSPVHLHS